ncbi:prepilin-type N-terminal cleavage/methylation domain-containing protein [bacterium]|nr:prepilin-type N-terminal cleavage/methylation domain-containing protein [bacterium]
MPPVSSRNNSHTCGFTLIELLIVVAIIAILAAIALPNFLEAQVRAKISRAKADMRSIATAVETYLVDNNHYPRARPDGGPNIDHPLSARLLGLTTPIAYITRVPPDAFPPVRGWNGDAMQLSDFDSYDYFDAVSDLDEDMSQPGGTDSTRGCAWRLSSAGPDSWASFGIVWGPRLGGGDREGIDYDPTNGSLSNGDILRVGSQVRAWTYDQATQSP